MYRFRKQIIRLVALLIIGILSACYNKWQKQQVIKTDESTTSSIALAPSEGKNVKRIDYEGFTIWLDCEKRGAVKFEYDVKPDLGNHKRSNKFFPDLNVPKECQQYSVNSYKAANGAKYDRGHLVPANHFDHSPSAIKSTNTMTNILPQAANMNRGAWLQTEEIIECFREDTVGPKEKVKRVIGGVIWGNNPEDDYFLESHGVKTPDAFWKVVIRGTGQVIAWIIPNSKDAKRDQLDEYLESIDEIERVTGEKIPVEDHVKHDKPPKSWMIPIGCNKG